MKKLYSVLLALVASTFLLGCSQGEEVHREATSPMSHDGPSTEMSPQRGQAEARTEALRYLHRLRPEARGLSAGHDLAVYPFLTPSTQRLRSLRDSVRYHLVDTMLYLVNVGKEEGTLLIAGDKRIPTVLGFIPEGHLTLEEINSHPGLRMIFGNAFGFYEQELERLDRELSDANTMMPLSKKLDSLPPAGAVKWSFGGNCHNDPLSDGGICHPRSAPDPWYWSQYEPTEQNEVVVKPICQVQWHQGRPYNLKAPLIEGERAASGCVATAIAQLCAVHHKPAKVRDLTLDWKLLTKYPSYTQYPASDTSAYSDQVSTLFRYVGDLLNNNWGTGGTGANTHNAPRILAQLGYRSNAKLVDFDVKAILAELDKGFPVLMRGARQVEPGLLSGHAWVCDGYLRNGYHRWAGHCSFYWSGNQLKMDAFIDYDIREYTYMLHYNWGWGDSTKGYGRGYFAAGLFNTERKADNKFTYRMEILTGIRP